MLFSESFIHWIVQGNSKKSQEVASFGLLVGGVLCAVGGGWCVVGGL